MNGLYGYPMTGLSGLGQTDRDVEVGVMSVLDGTAYDQIKALKKENAAQEKELMSQQTRIQKLQGAEKETAQALWRKAMDAHNQALTTEQALVAKYNETAEAVATYSMGAAKPKTLSGMGAIQLPVVAAIVVVGGAVLVALIYALDTLWATASGQTRESKGLILDSKSFIDSVGSSALDISKAGMYLIWSVAAIGAGYVAYKEYKRHRRSKSSGAAPVFSAPVELKTVEAEVIA